LYTGGLVDLLLYFCMCSGFILVRFLTIFHSPSPLDDDCSELFMFFCMCCDFTLLCFSSGLPLLLLGTMTGVNCLLPASFNVLLTNYMTDGEYFGFFCMVPRDVCWNVLPALVLIRTSHSCDSILKKWRNSCFVWFGFAVWSVLWVNWRTCVRSICGYIQSEIFPLDSFLSNLRSDKVVNW
jgi:hypothetical protein